MCACVTTVNEKKTWIWKSKVWKSLKGGNNPIASFSLHYIVLYSQKLREILLNCRATPENNIEISQKIVNSKLFRNTLSAMYPRELKSQI